MARSDKKRVRAAKAPVVRSAPKADAPCDDGASPEETAAYLDTLVKSGQAVPVTAGQPLPAGATHAIETGDAGQPKAVRRRFSIS